MSNPEWFTPVMETLLRPLFCRACSKRACLANSNILIGSCDTLYAYQLFEFELKTDEQTTKVTPITEIIDAMIEAVEVVK